jgi:flagellar M-ring protein FliF
VVNFLGDGVPRRQLILVLVVAGLACAALAGVYFAFLKTDYAVLFTGLRTADAATIVAELDRQKVPYRLADGGTRILVPEGKVDSTRLSVMGQDLPLKGQVGFELFNKSDMGLTDFAQRINYQRALQGELGRTIMTMPAVESARVHLSIGERSIFRDDRVPPKASVSLIPRTGRSLPPGAVRGIQRLVASAVPELDAENVTVVDAEGRILGSDLAGAGEPADSPELARIELHYEDVVRRALAGIAPAGTEVAVRAQRLPGAAEGVHAAAGRPDRRDVGLRVTVALGAAIAPDAEERVRAAVRSAIGGGDAATGDVVRITVAQEAGATGPAPEQTSSTAAVVPAEGWGWAWLWAGFALLVAGLVAIALRRRWAGERVLSEKQRDDFVSRFQALLEQEEASV